MDYWWIIFLIIGLINYGVITPFVVYFLWQFYKYRSCDVVAKRKPKLVISFSILTLINILIIRTYFAILSNLTYSGYEVDILNDPRIRTPFIWVTQLTASLLFFRLWIMFYDWRRAVYRLELKWSKQLLSTQDQHWTLKYGFLGNEQILIICAIVHYILGVVASIIAIQVNEGENGLAYDLIYFVDSIIVCVPYIILSFVSQKFHDSIGVRDEIRAVAIIFIIGVIGFGVGGSLTKDTVFRSQGTFAWSGLISLLIVLRILYVKQIENYINVTSTRSVVRHIGLSLTYSKDLNDSGARSPRNGQKRIFFGDVLKHEEGFKIFANHLLKEYSVETLLFLLELTQIKAAIISHYRELFASPNSKQYSHLQKDIERAIGSMTYTIEIAPEILHLSDDAYKDITIEKVINLWKYLYKQYIIESSNSCINISHVVRQTILTSINKHNLNIASFRYTRNTTASPPSAQQHREHPELELASTESNNSVLSNGTGSKGSYKLESHAIVMELISAFDGAAKEIYMLLETDSWPRFKRTQEFATWKAQFGNQRKFTI